MKTIPAVIEALGGSATIAKALGRSYSTVNSWKARGSIPCEVWPGLLVLGRRRRIRGLSLQKLARLQVEQKSGRAA